MATRVYTQSSGTPSVTPTAWAFAAQSNPVSVPGTLTLNTGSVMTAKAEATGIISPIMQAMGRTILGPLAAATLSGSVKGQMRGMESNAGANATLALAIKLVQPDGSDRGVLLAPTAADSATVGNELIVSTLTNAQFKTAAESPTLALTTQSAQAGDYLVIEWGFRAATTTNRTITLSYGNDSATPLPEDTTTTAAQTPWWEFTADFSLLALPPIAVGAVMESSILTAIAWAPQARYVSPPSEAAVPQAVAWSPRERLVAGVIESAASQTMTPPGATPNLALPFTNTTSITFPGAVSGLDTAHLCLAVYDAAVPAVRMAPGSLTVHPTSYDITLAFAQPQSGTLVVNAGRPPAGPQGNFLQPFTAQMSLTIPGSVHQLGTAALLVEVFDAATPARRLQPGHLSVEATSYDVVVTFAQPQSGVMVLCGYTGTGDTGNSSTAFTAQTSVTVLGTTHSLGTSHLMVDVYDAASPARLLEPGSVTVDPTTHDVTVSFAQPQSGRIVLNGSQRATALGLAPATESASVSAVQWAPQQRLLTPVLSPESGQTVTLVRATLVGLPTETATAPALAPFHTALVAALPETMTSQVLTGLKARLLGPPTESTTAHPLTTLKRAALGLGVETVTAPPVGRLKTVLLSLPLDTGTSQAFNAPSAVLLGQPLETPSAEGLAARKTFLLVSVLSAETGQGLSRLTTVGPGLPTETVTAPPLVSVKTALLPQTVSPEMAQTLAWAPRTRLTLPVLSPETVQPMALSPLTRLLLAVLSPETAQPSTAPGAALLQAVVETATAPPTLWAPKLRQLTPVLEAETPQAVTAALIRFLLQVLETETGPGLLAPGTTLVTSAVETATAQLVTWRPQARLLSLVVETAQAHGLTAPTSRLVLASVETAMSQSVLWSQVRLLVASLETTSATLVTWSPQARLVAEVLETEMPQVLSWVPQQLLLMVTETTTATDLGAFHGVLLGYPVETASSEPLLPPHKTAWLLQVSEAGTALGIASLRLVPLDLLTETATGENLGTAKTIVLADLEELAQALGMTWSPQARFVGVVTETDVVSLLTAISGIIRYAITGTWSSTPVLSGAWEVVPRVDGTAWCAVAVLTGAVTTAPVVEAQAWNTASVVTGEVTLNEYE